jgi:3-oxoacyl-[acyl-carrier protein] reductase
MSDAPLNNQVALITGASSGIGQAIAETFARAGAHLVVVARREERLQHLAELSQQAGRQCQIIAGDVRQPEVARQAVEATFAYFGQLDILVNNAGIGRYGDLVNATVDDYDAMMDTNMRSTFLFTHAAVPRLLQQKRGTIIVISSMAGVMGFPGEAIYCSTKFAQVGFALAMERELRPHGIRVGVVMPGGVKTEFAIGTGRTEAGVAASGMLEAQDVANAALLMATQPPHARIVEIRMRPMVEPYYGVEQS